MNSALRYACLTFFLSAFSAAHAFSLPTFLAALKNTTTPVTNTVWSNRTSMERVVIASLSIAASAYLIHKFWPKNVVVKNKHALEDLKVTIELAIGLRDEDFQMDPHFVGLKFAKLAPKLSLLQISTKNMLREHICKFDEALIAQVSDTILYGIKTELSNCITLCEREIAAASREKEYTH